MGIAIGRNRRRIRYPQDGPVPAKGTSSIGLASVGTALTQHPGYSSNQFLVDSRCHARSTVRSTGAAHSRCLSTLPWLATATTAGTTMVFSCSFHSRVYPAQVLILLCQRMSSHLFAYKGRGGGAVRQMRRAGSDPRLRLTGRMERPCARGCG